MQVEMSKTKANCLDHANPYHHHKRYREGKIGGGKKC
jgi:hypothetical protein